MKKPTHVGESADQAMICNRAWAGGLFLLGILFLGASSASAAPRATISNCPTDWAYNPGAQTCLLEGQEDAIAGVPPRYVACLSDGSLFCCSNNAQGGQDCVAIEDQTLGTRSPLGDLQASVQFGGLQITTTTLNQLQQEVQDIKNEVDQLYSDQCSPPPVQ